MEQPSTYMFSLEDRRELARLSLQGSLFDEIIPRFPPLFVPPKGGRIVDLASGTGGWALQVAESFDVSVMGVDASIPMIQYARAQAETRQLAAQFCLMEIERFPWHFPDMHFNLVNGRFISGCFQVEMWSTLLAETYRVLKSGGMFRSTEAVHMSSPTAETVTKLGRYTYAVMKQRGMVFSTHDMAVSPVVAQLLRQTGFEDISFVPYVVDLSFGSPLHKAMGQSFRMANELLKPLISKNHPQENIDELYQRWDEEWDSRDFTCYWFVASVSGVKR